MGTSQREQILSFKSSSLRYGTSLYHIRWVPLIDIIFITHVRILHNGSYANGVLTLHVALGHNKLGIHAQDSYLVVKA